MKVSIIYAISQDLNVLCFSFADGDPIVHEEEGGPSEAKKVNPMARLNKVLKFRLFLEADGEDGADKPS